MIIHHVTEYPNEHNISYAEIRPLLDLRFSRAYASLRGYDLYVWVHDTDLVNRFPHIIGCGKLKL